MSNSTDSYPPLTAKDFETQYDADHVYIFTEDEWGDMLYTYGHDRDAEFARQANEFDIYAGSVDPEDYYTADDVDHRWAITIEPSPEWRCKWAGVDEHTPGAFPVSVIWR